MTDKHILHMLTPLKHMSPFDVNMALDAGYDAAIAYTNVMLDEVGGLVQDAIFSRPPKTGVRTGMFIGGKNAILALDMLSAAKKALVPPFGISFFADPAGSFTTAAAMVACVEKSLLDKKKRSLKDLKLAVFGATGVVGFSSAVIAALEGADVTLVGYDGTKRVSEAAREIKARFQVDVHVADGSDDTKKAEILAEAEAALCAGRAGVRILSSAQLVASEASSDRGRRQRRSPFRGGGPGHDGKRRGAHSPRHARHWSACDRQHQVQDRIRLVPAHDRRDETGDLRLSQCIPARARVK